MFLSKNVKNPDNIQGRVLVSFVIEKDGSLTDLKVAKNLSPKADDEAIRVMKLSPKWKPAMQNNNPVRSMYSIPVKFGNK